MYKELIKVKCDKCDQLFELNPTASKGHGGRYHDTIATHIVYSDCYGDSIKNENSPSWG